MLGVLCNLALMLVSFSKNSERSASPCTKCPLEIQEPCLKKRKNLEFSWFEFWKFSIDHLFKGGWFGCELVVLCLMQALWIKSLKWSSSLCNHFWCHSWDLQSSVPSWHRIIQVNAQKYCQGRLIFPESSTKMSQTFWYFCEILVNNRQKLLTMQTQQNWLWGRWKIN